MNVEMAVETSSPATSWPAWQRLATPQFAFTVAVLSVAALIAILAPTFASIVAIWQRDATFAHGFLIIPIVLILLWRERAKLAEARIRAAPAGFVAMLALAGVWLLGELVGAQILSQGAAVAMIPAVLWSVLGADFVRRARFPLCYLAFAVPAGDALVPPLMELTADFTVGALRLTGLPVWREGLLFSIPSGDFEVVKACSGIRYLIASVALGTLFAYLNFRSYWRRVAFLALAVLVPLLANCLRAYGIVMIAHLSEMRYATDVDHLVYGWLFFGVVIALTFWLGTLFSDRLPGTAPVSAGTGRAPRSRSPIGAQPAAALLALVPVVAAPVALDQIRRDSIENATAPRPVLPVGVAAWSGPTNAETPWRPLFAGADEWLRGGYEADTARVLVQVGFYSAESNDEGELANSTNSITDGQEWRERVHAEAQVWLAEGARRTVVETAIESRQERRRVWHWYLVNGRPTASRLGVRWLQAGSWMLGRAPRAALITISTNDEGTAEEAEARLLGFTRTMGLRLEQCVMRVREDCDA